MKYIDLRLGMILWLDSKTLELICTMSDFEVFKKASFSLNCTNGILFESNNFTLKSGEAVYYGEQMFVSKSPIYLGFLRFVQTKKK